MTDRFIPATGCFNLRDVGGYAGLDGATVRRGVIFRADSLSRVPTAELRALVERLEIRTTIDLRGAAERDHVGVIDSESVPGEHLHLSAIDGAANARTARPIDASRLNAARDVGELYLTMFQAAATTYTRCVELFADAGSHGVAFFCAAGKDRTGTLAAVDTRAVGGRDRRHRGRLHPD